MSPGSLGSYAGMLTSIPLHPCLQIGRVAAIASKPCGVQTFHLERLRLSDEITASTAMAMTPFVKRVCCHPVSTGFIFAVYLWFYILSPKYCAMEKHDLQVHCILRRRSSGPRSQVVILHVETVRNRHFQTR